MRLPIQAQPIMRGADFSKTTSDGIQPSWNCGSKCKWYQPDCYAWKAIWCTPEGKFARCMGFPNTAEAAVCLAAVLKCAPTAAGGPAYGVCVGVACGAAGAAHSYRCAKDSGLI
jgi:hypothetical protein